MKHGYGPFGLLRYIRQSNANLLLCDTVFRQTRMPPRLITQPLFTAMERAIQETQL